MLYVACIFLYYNQILLCRVYIICLFGHLFLIELLDYYKYHCYGYGYTEWLWFQEIKYLNCFLFLMKKSIFSCVCGGVEYVHMSAGTHRGQGRASYFLELQLHVSEPSNQCECWELNTCFH